MKRKRIICSACSFCLGDELIKSQLGKFRLVIKKGLSNVRIVKHCYVFFLGLLRSSHCWRLLGTGSSLQTPFLKTTELSLRQGGGRGDLFRSVPALCGGCHAGKCVFFKSVYTPIATLEILVELAINFLLKTRRMVLKYLGALENTLPCFHQPPRWAAKPLMSF